MLLALVQIWVHPSKSRSSLPGLAQKTIRLASTLSDLPIQFGDLCRDPRKLLSLGGIAALAHLLQH